MLPFENTVTEDLLKFELSIEKWQWFFLADSYEKFIKCYLFEMLNLCLSMYIFIGKQPPSYSVVNTWGIRG